MDTGTGDGTLVSSVRLVNPRNDVRADENGLAAGIGSPIATTLVFEDIRCSRSGARRCSRSGVKVIVNRR